MTLVQIPQIPTLSKIPVYTSRLIEHCHVRMYLKVDGRKGCDVTQYFPNTALVIMTSTAYVEAKLSPSA
jgi:hypothetical protein